MTEASNATASQPRRRGRPRKDGVEADVLAATIELVVEVGYARTTMEEVAVRARVGRATLYRRWRSKDEMVMDALMTRERDYPLPTASDGLSTREALTQVCENFIHATTNTPLGRAFPAVIAEAVRNPEFGRLFREYLVEPRHGQLEQIVARGVARGEIRPDVKPADVIDMLVGLMYYRLTVTRRAADVMTVGDVVETLFAGIQHDE